MTAALEGGEWSAAHPGRTLLPGKTRYPFYRRLDRPQGRSGRAENLVPIPTVQPVAQSLYRLSYPAHTHTHICFMYTHTHTHTHLARLTSMVTTQSSVVKTEVETINLVS